MAQRMHAAVVGGLAALFIVCLHADAAVTGSFRSTIQAPFGWEYFGSLGQDNWWPLGFSGCDVDLFPKQSPIDIEIDNLTTPVQTLVLAATNGAKQSVSAIMHPETTNVLRADVWPSSLLTTITRNGVAAQYVMHHIAVHFPSQNVIQHLAVDGEISFVFFPVNGTRYSEYQTGGVNLVMPFIPGDVPVTRFDYTLLALKQSYTTGVAKMLFSFPSFGACALYEGSLAFPPCIGNMTTVVNLSPLTLNADTVATLRGLTPYPVTQRHVVPLGNRSLFQATVDVTGLYDAPETEAEVAAHTQRYILVSTPLDVTIAAYRYGALCVGLLCVVLVACIAVQLYERFSFVSVVRDTWVNPVTEQTTFGCAKEQEDSDEEDEEEEDEEDDEDGEEGDEEE